MDDFVYQIKLSQIENCSSVQELVSMFKHIFREYADANHIYGDCSVNFNSSSNKSSYVENYTSILVSDLLGNIYNRLIDSKQMTTDHFKSLLTKPFPPIDKEQAIKNIKAFHGLI